MSPGTSVRPRYINTTSAHSHLCAASRQTDATKRGVSDLRRRTLILIAGGVLAGCLAFAGPALAAQRNVCHLGCPYTSIQSAINAASPGDTIAIGAGSYYENVVVNKPVTLRGSARSA